MISLTLRSRLLLLIIAVMAAVLLPLGIISARRTLGEVDELSDGRLAQAARTLEVLANRIGIEQLREQRVARLLVPSTSGHPEEFAVKGHAFESEVGFQIFDRDGTLLLATHNLAGVPARASADGRFENVTYGDRKWRLFTLVTEPQGVTIRTGERYDSRHAITRALWIVHGLPTLLGLPLLALLVGWAIRRGLRPLNDLATALARREPGSRDPIHLSDAPSELTPVLAALNEQLLSLESALERERRFSADVAQELRTPLASILANLENAMVSAQPDHVETALLAAREALVLLARRSEQLLVLARLEAGAAAGPRAPVDLVTIAIGVIEELSPVIARSSVELSIENMPDRLQVDGYAPALGALLRNLLENAFRHAPAGGHVGLSITLARGAAVIEVVDDGPGIPAHRRLRMFNRVQYGGCADADGDGPYGLGLSIVQRAAELHGASVELLDRDDVPGLRVAVTLPL